LQRFYELMPQPITLRGRLLLMLLVVPLALSFTMPLWNIHMVAPQYPGGLDLNLYAHTIEGDVSEINTLNHYIGMARIDRAALSDLDWIPFAIGGLVLFALRVAVLGNVRSLIDLSVLLSYFGLFSLGRFYYKMYVFGHNLDPRAPFYMDPFTPVVFGSQQIANFTTSSYPRGGTLLISIFALGVIGLVAWHVARGLKEAKPSG
jgi:hypothetical protein